MIKMSGVFQCTDGQLQSQAVLATTVAQPVEPYPLFSLKATNCNAGLASLSDNVFPNVSQSVTFEIVEGDLDPTSKATISKVNDVETFIGKDGELLSIWVPFNYRVYFFSSDPRHTPTDTLFSEKHLNLAPSTLLESTLDVRLTDGSLFIEAKDADGNRVVNSGTIESVTYNAKYMVACRLESYERSIVDMCTRGRQLTIGTASLNNVWKAQTEECDAFIRGYCALSNNPDASACRCFSQQERLDAKYGKEAGVPVACFGSDVTEDGELPCSQDNKAYRTQSMIDNECTFPVCQEVVRKNGILQTVAEEKGITSISCVQQSVEMPKPLPPNQRTGHNGVINDSVEPEPVLEARDTLVKTEIPIYVWAILAVGVLLFIAFLVEYVRKSEANPVDVQQSASSFNDFTDS